MATRLSSDASITRSLVERAGFVLSTQILMDEVSVKVAVG